MINNLQRSALIMIIILTGMSFKSKHLQSQVAVYRVFANNKYRILDSTGFFLYSRYEQTEVNKGKGEIMAQKYFFSKTRDSMIKPLTMANIENTFSDNTRFRLLLESHFRNDQELTAFDKYLKDYKIEYLYSQSFK